MCGLCDCWWLWIPPHQYYSGDVQSVSVVLKDMFTGADYPVDEKTGLPFSAGPDKLPNTDDDIRLLQ